MNPYHGDPLNPFGVSFPGDPMEEVLALQSYGLAAADADAWCLSWESKIVEPVCRSQQSVVAVCASTLSVVVIGAQPVGEAK